VQHDASGPTTLQERDDDRHHHGRAADEDARYRRFRGALGGDDREVEADHAHGGQQREAGPLAERERPQPGRGPRAGQRDEQHAGQAVAQELAARVRVLTQDAVGGEGPSDEDTGECGEQGSPRGGGVHGSDARERGGPV
jgi:hypothetical protein